MSPFHTMKLLGVLLLTLILTPITTFANQVVIHMSSIATSPAHDHTIGTITAKDSQYGLLLIPNLHQLPPGEHGFHVHTNPSCGNQGLAAGDHLDPSHSNQHLGPYNPNGHLGDLPLLYVNTKGEATTPVLAPRLTVEKIRNHALIIHSGGDNYSDHPNKLGGGGSRIACGIVPPLK